MTKSNSTLLTAADWRLLQSLNQGLSNKDLADLICKSEFTVRNKLSLLYKKINVSSRNQAAFWYRENLLRQDAAFNAAASQQSQIGFDD